MSTVKRKVSNVTSLEEARAVARELKEIFREGVVERDRHSQFPHEELQLFKESGLMALMIPEKYGGLGGGFSDLMEVTAILSEGDPNIGQMYQLNNGGVMIINELADPDTRKEIFNKIVREKLYIGNAYSEIGTKHVNDFKSRLRRDPKGGWRLNGKKYYCTGSLAADFLFGPALEEDTGKVRLFFVPAKAPGISIEVDWDVMGQRCTASGTITFDDVWVPDNLCLDTESSSPTNPIALVYQTVHTAVFLGIARNALEDAVKFVREKARPWYESNLERAADDPYVQLTVGRMKMLVDAAEGLVLRAGELCDKALREPGEEIRGLASLVTGEARTFAANVAIEVGELLFKVCGTSSIHAKYGYDRHWRNARALSLHNPLDYKLKHVGEYLLLDKLPPVDAYN